MEIYPAQGLYQPYEQASQKIPEEYKWLKHAPDGPVLEWPISKNFIGDAVAREYDRVGLFHSDTTTLEIKISNPKDKIERSQESILSSLFGKNKLNQYNFNPLLSLNL